MFAYCENEPISGFDPTGEQNNLGVAMGFAITAAGVAIIASAVFTGGASLPLVGFAVKATALAAGIGVTETGITTAFAAQTEGTMVLDVTCSDGFIHDKQGYSIVIDFDSESATTDVYYHYGKSTAGYGASYGVGIVFGYEKPGDYGGFFADTGITYSRSEFDYGIDVCTDPSNPFCKCSAVLATVGVSFPRARNGLNLPYGGIDYYCPLATF